MDASDPEEVLAAWRRCALPAVVAEWLATMKGARGRLYMERAARFIAFADQTSEQHDQLLKAWRAVAGAPRSPDDDAPELAIFISLPDRVTLNPHSALYGGRRVDRATIALERKRYAGLRTQVAGVRAALRPDSLRTLLEDASPSKQARAAAGAFRQRDLNALADGLRALEHLLEVVNPAEKVPTAHWASSDAADKVFAGQVASLNRHLTKPRHAALVALARVNCPDARLNAAQVAKAWSRMDKHA
jgi:hypothetical protein